MSGVGTCNGSSRLTGFTVINPWIAGILGLAAVVGGLAAAFGMLKGEAKDAGDEIEGVSKKKGLDKNTPYDVSGHRDLAARHHTAFIPMIYKDLVHVPDSIQADGIHPTARGSEIIADTLFPALKPLLKK